MSYLFAFSYCSWGSQGKNTKVVCHCLLQWTTFCQTSPPWPNHLGWPYMAWLIVSLSSTRLWSMWSDWLVSCDCGFQSVCPLMEKDKRLMEASWWERLRRGKLGLVMMGGAMLSKSLIQFSVGGQGCVPSLLFTWGQTMVDIMIMVISFKRSHACTATLTASNPPPPPRPTKDLHNPDNHDGVITHLEPEILECEVF